MIAADEADSPSIRYGTLVPSDATNFSIRPSVPCRTTVPEYTPLNVFLRPATAKTRDWWAGNDEDADPPAAGPTASAQQNNSNDTFACCQASLVRDDYFVIFDRLYRFGGSAVVIAVRRVALRTPSAFARKPTLQMRRVA